MSDGWFKKNWTKTRTTLGLKGVRFHDLRHTAGTLAAQNGATLKEVMNRLGHSTTAAAIRYQRAADDRDHEVADRLDEVFGTAASRASAPASNELASERLGCSPICRSSRGGNSRGIGLTLSMNRAWQFRAGSSARAFG